MGTGSKMAHQCPMDLHRIPQELSAEGMNLCGNMRKDSTSRLNGDAYDAHSAFSGRDEDLLGPWDKTAHVGRIEIHRNTQVLSMEGTRSAENERTDSIS